jgi:hypothetical protein
MNISIKIDEKEYDKRQMQLLDFLVREIIYTLDEEGVPPDKIPPVAKSLAFGICTILDASRVMEVDGKTLRPFLTFAENYVGTELVARRAASNLHDESNDHVDKVFKSFPAA